MKMSADCIHCVLGQLDKYFMRFVGDEEQRFEFLRTACTEIGTTAPDTPAPVISAKLMNIITRRAGREDLFKEEKRTYNQAILEIEDSLKARIAAADDKLCRALQYAMTGNYIDFALVREVSRGKLDELIEAAPDIDLKPTLERFRRDIAQARSLVYVLDNCGEAVFDKICIGTMQALYPALHITALVRGMPTYNDVTPADAREIKLDELVNVVGNGDGTPGTMLPRISDEARMLLENADVIVSKGMGNYETLKRCGLNVYYMLLCKCDRFMQEFQKPRYAGIFTSEKDLT